MNETAFADRLVELINSASNDDDYMLLHTARSFSEDMLIAGITDYMDPRQPDVRKVEIHTSRGDLFLVEVERIRAGVPA